MTGLLVQHNISESVRPAQSHFGTFSESRPCSSHGVVHAGAGIYAGPTWRHRLGIVLLARTRDTGAHAYGCALPLLTLPPRLCGESLGTPSPSATESANIGLLYPRFVQHLGDVSPGPCRLRRVSGQKCP